MNIIEKKLREHCGFGDWKSDFSNEILHHYSIVNMMEGLRVAIHATHYTCLSPIKLFHSSVSSIITSFSVSLGRANSENIQNEKSEPGLY